MSGLRRALLCLALGPALAHAATYHVATTGDDRTPCGAGPRQTINAGVTCLQGGDTLVIGGGVYEEILSNWDTAVTTPIPNGTPGQPTVIRAASGERVVLRPLSASYPGGGGVVTTTAHARDITFEGINVDAVQHHTYGVSLDGAQIVYLRAEVTNARSNGVASFRGDGITMASLHIHHNGLQATGYPKPHGMYVCGTNKVIAQNVVHDNANYGIQVSCETGGIRGAVVRDNLVYNHPGRGIQIQGSTNLVEHNMLRDNGIGIGIAGGSGTIVQRNTISGYRPLPDNYGILSQSSTVIIRDNRLERQRGYTGYIFWTGGQPPLANNCCDQPGQGCARVGPCGGADPGQIPPAPPSPSAPPAPAPPPASGGEDPEVPPVPPPPVPAGGAPSWTALVNRQCVHWRLEGPCVCNPFTPCVRVAYWEPGWLVETVKRPGTTTLPGLQTILDGALSLVGTPALGGGGAGNATGSGHTNLHYNDVHVYTFPQLLGGPCTDCTPGSIPLTLHYASEVDPTWRTATATPSPLDLVQQIGVWGRLYPRGGKVIHGSEPVGSGLAVARAMHIAHQPVGTPPNVDTHVVLQPILGTSLCLQLAHPRRTQCLDAGTPPPLWEHATVSPRGTYVWVVWRKRACCVNPTQTTCGMTLPGVGGHGANTCLLPSTP